MFQNRMILIRGCSGSGKSFAAMQFFLNFPNSVIFSTDEIFCSMLNRKALTDDSNNLDVSKEYFWSAEGLAQAHQLNKIKTAVACERGVKNVIVDNTNTTYKEVAPYLGVAAKFGYEVILFSPNNEWSKNVNICKLKNVHNVPVNVIQAQLDRFQSNDKIIEDAKKEFPDLKIEEIESLEKGLS